MTGQEYASLLMAYIGYLKDSKYDSKNEAYDSIPLATKFCGPFAIVYLNPFTSSSYFIRTLYKKDLLPCYLIYVTSDFGMEVMSVTGLQAGRTEWEKLVQQGKAFCYTEEDFKYSDCYMTGGTSVKEFIDRMFNGKSYQSDSLFMIDEDYLGFVLDDIKENAKECMQQLASTLVEKLLSTSFSEINEGLIEKGGMNFLNDAGIVGFYGIVVHSDGLLAFNDGVHGLRTGISDSAEELEIGTLYFFPANEYELTWSDNQNMYTFSSDSDDWVKDCTVGVI